MAIGRSILSRALQVVIVALFVTAGTAILVRIVPGDPARTILGSKATPQALAALRVDLGLNRSLLDQVVHSLGNLAQGDLGTSFVERGRHVSSIIASSFGVTASVVGLTIVISILAGVPGGLWLALTRRPAIDLVGRFWLTVLLALPGFIAALIVLYLLSLRLGVAPAGGWAGAWPANARYVWLPALALSLYLGSLIARAVRQAALETMAQPFVEAARARGVARRRVIVRHVLPNALLPVITLVGFNAGVLVSGAVTVEVVFALPGLGAQLLQSMGARDLPIVQGIALITAVAIVVLNLLADVLYIAVDPRLRSAR